MLVQCWAPLGAFLLQFQCPWSSGLCSFLNSNGTVKATLPDTRIRQKKHSEKDQNLPKLLPVKSPKQGKKIKKETRDAKEDMKTKNKSKKPNKQTKKKQSK